MKAVETLFSVFVVICFSGGCVLGDLIIYQKTYDFMLYLFPIVDRFPKYEKFVLCSQIKNGVLDIARGIVRANKSRHKKSLLFDLDVKLEELRLLVRFSHDRKYLTTKSYEYASKLIAEIGRLLGGWIKSQG